MGRWIHRRRRLLQREHQPLFRVDARPEFVVTQGERSVASLERLQSFFGCGAVHRNAEIARIVERMNRRKPSDFLRILRDCTPAASR